MKKGFLIFILLLIMIQPSRALGDFFGGDVAVLTKILANAVDQLEKLNSIVRTGEEHLRFMEDIHRGLEDSMEMMETIGNQTNSGIYHDWKEAGQALDQINQLYGIVTPNTPESQIQKDTDRSVAEAISLNNAIYDYTRELDVVGSQIKDYSHLVSPVGAQKLSAQSMGVMLHILNQNLRAQATALKLQAQTLAIQNHKDKVITKHESENSKAIKREMKKSLPPFHYPRF